MKKNLNSRQALRARRSLLASAAVIALGAAAPAMADMPQGGNYSMGTYQGSPEQMLSLSDYVMWITSPQLNTGVVSSTASGVRYETSLFGGNYGYYYDEGPVYVMGTPVTQARNSIAALSTGNQNTSSIALGLLANQGEWADGVATLTGQLRSGAATQALVEGSGIATSLGGMPAAPQVLHANSITAATTLNQSSSSVAGQVPAGYASQRGGWATAGLELANGEYTGVNNETAGSVGVSTAQVAINAGQRAGSHATVSNGLVLMNIAGQGTTGEGAAAAPSLSITDNSIGAQYRANQSENQFRAQTGSAAFQGSVVVSNVQANIEGQAGSTTVPNTDGPTINTFSSETPSGPTARVTNSAIVADVRSTFYEGEGYGSTGLTGALALTGNTLSASSTGNIASSRDANGNVVAGNAIVFAGGADIRGAQSEGVAMVGMIEGGTRATSAADLALMNIQGNQSTVLSSEMAGGLVGAFADSTSKAGSVALTGNSLSATASGNVAGNRISAAATNIAANAAASSAQSNSNTDILASTYGTAVSASIGSYYDRASGTVAVSSNAITSSASGNLAETQVALSGTHLATGGRPAGASSDTWGFPLVSANGDAVAVNMQGNYGGKIGAETTGASIGADFADQWYGEGQRTGLSSADVSVNNNAIRAQALGNDAATSVALAGTTGNSSAAVGNSQYNDARIKATVKDSGVALAAADAYDSRLAITGNTLAATAKANSADNRLTAQFETLQAATAQYSPAYSINGNSGISVDAAQTIVSAQHNSGTVSARNVSSDAMAVVRVGASQWSDGDVPYNSWGGTVGSSIAVKGNTASAAATANEVANTLAMSVGTLSSSEGFGAPVAAIRNMQTNWAEGKVTATAGGNHGAGLLVGVQYEGEVVASQLSVDGNTVSAQSLGNTAANRLSASGVNFGANSSGYGYEGPLGSDFSVLSQQMDSGDTRSATTKSVKIGVEAGSNYWSGGLIQSNVSITGNRNLAEARNNNAANSVDLSGFSTLAASAAVGNMQDSGTAVEATAEGRMRIRARDTLVLDSALALTGNVTQAMAVANSADNSLSAQATQLQGKSSPWVITGMPESGYNGSPDFAVGNMQFQGGPVTASANASNRIDLDGSTMIGGSATLTGNAVAAIAQANSASSALSLQAGNASAVTGAVMSSQYAGGPVYAVAESSGSKGAFSTIANNTNGTPVVVANNTLRASAGMNEAFNQQTVQGTTVAGRGLGNNPSAYGFGYYESSMPAADFSVGNQQSGSGDVTAVALPGMIGTAMGSNWGGSVAVTGNDVTAKASVNNASNALVLASQSTLSASGAVSNLQTTEGGSGQAWIGTGAPTLVGVSAANLGNTVVTVTGNSLNAVAGANQTSNVLNATAANGTSGQGNVASFAVLNQQGNSATMNAVVQNTAIGVTMSGYNTTAPVNNFSGGYGYGMNASNASVQGNSVLASGYGNTASNSLGLSAPAAAASTASASIVNRQTNSAAISASVQNVGVGIGGSATGSAVAITGNSVTAQAVGNSATNVLSIK